MKNPTLALLLCTVGNLSAATLSISLSPKLPETPSPTFSMDSYGAADWAIWKKSAGTTSTNASPTNEKAGASLISSLSTVDLPTTTTGGFQASTTGNMTWDFSYTDGSIAPTGGTYFDVNGVFNSNIKKSGSGLSLTVTLPTTDAYQIFLWAGGFHFDNGQLTASLSGATSAVNNGLTADDVNIKDMYLYTITAQADNANDVVTLSLINNDSVPFDFSHLIISAAAVQLIPEPSALLLSSLGALALLRRKR